MANLKREYCYEEGCARGAFVKGILWRPEDLTPGVESSTAGRFSFLSSLSWLSYALRSGAAGHSGKMRSRTRRY